MTGGAARRGVLRALAGPAVLVGFVVLFLFGPLKWPCPLATIAHVPCPTCGMTRATKLALHGELAAATRMHPLWMVVLAAVVAIGAREVAGFAREGRWGTAAGVTWVRRLAGGVMALLVIVWVARFFGAFGGPVGIS